MQNKSKKYLVVVGVALVLAGLFAATFGTTHITMYNTITSTSYSIETTITACHSNTDVPPPSCTTSGALVYSGTIIYSTASTTSQIVIPFQTPSYILNYLGVLVALVGACSIVITILYRKKHYLGLGEGLGRNRINSGGEMVGQVIERFKSR